MEQNGDNEEIKPLELIDKFPKIERLRELQLEIFSESYPLLKVGIEKKLEENSKIQQIEKSKEMYTKCLEYEKLFVDFQNYYCQKIGIGFNPIHFPFSTILKDIQNFKKIYHSSFDSKAKKYYNTHIITTDKEEVNGYKLYECSIHLFSYEDFLETMLEVENRIDKEYNIDFQKFFEKCDDKMCTEWAKMDRNGGSYEGVFWKAEEGSEEKMNAWNLTREDNIKGLWELPYSKTMIFKTIKIGCANRQESVRYSNFLCEWIMRMKDELYNKEKVVIKIEKKHLMHQFRERVKEYIKEDNDDEPIVYI